MEQQAKDILKQEPQAEKALAGQPMPWDGYIAYLNMDFLDMVFSDQGWQGDPERQQQYIDELNEGLAEVIRNHERCGMMLSWSWYDNKNRLRRAIEVMPVMGAANGLTIVTPDVTGYDALNKRLDEAQATIHKLQNELEQTKHRLERVMRKKGIED